MRVSSSATPLNRAVRSIAACQEWALATGGRINSASAIPSGQLVTRMPSAVTISRPWNQSVTILVTSTLKKIAPVPESTRPTMSQAVPSACAISRPPTVMAPSPTQATVLSP